MPTARPFAVIAGGGTGGHVNPALAIADALGSGGRPREDVWFVGSRRGLEASLVPQAGYRITLLPGRGIARRLTPANLSAIAGLVMALVRAVVLLARRRPKVVVSVGGYAAAPCAIAAVLLGIPLVLAESNAIPGAVHRLVGRFAKAAAVALPGTRLPRATVTGNPVRPEIIALDRAQQREASRAELGLPADRKVVAIFGGSLGATTLNRSAAELALRWKNRGDVALYQVVGARDWADDDGDSPGEVSGQIVHRKVQYQADMAAMYSAADVVVCRSGATTVAELTVVGMPAVLVPFPRATADHQSANARTLESKGAAVVVPDGSCDGARLDAVLSTLLTDPNRLTEMSKAAKALGVPDAAERTAALVERCARG